MAKLENPVLMAKIGAAQGLRGEVRVKTDEVTILLGRDFLLDGELAGHIEALPGVTGIELKNSETRLALVG